MNERVLDKVEYLNDLELTILASLTAGEHCIISGASTTDQSLGQVLATTCQATFGIAPALLHCDAHTTVDELNDSLLHTDGDSIDDSDFSTTSSRDKELSHRRRQSDEDGADGQHIANIAVLADLDLTSDSVQVQVIELLRVKRIFTRDAMHTAPKDFLLIVTLSRPDARLSHHLNDLIASSYTYSETSAPVMPGVAALMSMAEIDHLRRATAKVRLTAEIDGYLHNIVIFMRQSRYVHGGMSSAATRQLRALSKALAPMHGIDFVTPSLVMLAARRIYAHRLVLATAMTEASLQWGSDPEAVERLLKGMTVNAVIEDVIASVETPL